MATKTQGGMVRNAPQNDDESVDAEGTEAHDRSGSAEDRLSERDKLFARIDAQRNAGVQEDIDYAFSTGDPAAAQAEAARRKATKDKAPDPQEAEVDAPHGEGAEPDPKQETDAEVTDDNGAGTSAPALPPEVVMQSGKAMLKLKVDGAERLVPLDTAIAQLQKGEAAEVRLQKAAELRKQLDAREAELNQRQARQSSGPPPATDAELEAEAKGLVDSLLTDDPAVAAKKLTGVLVKVRQAATPSIDENAIVSKAVQATRTTLKAESHAESLVTGLSKFQSEYPEIAKDPKLEAVADGMTDAIATENPSWTPEQVMLEAGKRTRAWVDSLRGGDGSAQNTSQNALDALATQRRDRKQNLRPLPPARSQRQQAARQQEQRQETPADVVAEMRRARGQAV